MGASRSWKRQGNGFTPRTSRRNSALPTHFRLLSSRFLREQICVVLSHHRGHVNADCSASSRVWLCGNSSNCTPSGRAGTSLSENCINLGVNVCKKTSTFHLSNELLLPTKQKGRSPGSGSLPGNQVQCPHSSGVETEAQRDEEMCLRLHLILPKLGKSRVNILFPLPPPGFFPPPRAPAYPF